MHGKNHFKLDTGWKMLSRFYTKMRSNRYQIFFSFFKRSSSLTNTTIVMFLWQSFINNYYREKSYSVADFCIKIYINMFDMALITFTQPKTSIGSSSSELDKCLQLLSQEKPLPTDDLNVSLTTTFCR